MSKAKQRRVGILLAPFIGLLTIGLPKPAQVSGNDEATTDTSTAPAATNAAAIEVKEIADKLGTVAASATVSPGVAETVAAEVSATAAVDTAPKAADEEAKAEETINENATKAILETAAGTAGTTAAPVVDWARAQSFQLPARLAVNRQLNRPKKSSRRQVKAVRDGLRPASVGADMHGTNERRGSRLARTGATIIEFPKNARTAGKAALEIAA